MSKMMQLAKRLTGRLTVNAITQGFWLHRGLAAEGASCAQLSYGSEKSNELQHHDHFMQRGSSSASQDSSADPHPCSLKTGHHSDNDIPRPAHAPSLSFQPLIRQHQSTSAPAAFRGLLGPAGRHRSNTFASYSSTSGPSTPEPPPLSQSAKSTSLSGGGLPNLVAEANSILQTVDIMRFRERLQLESETKQRVTMAELMAMCRESGAAQSSEEAGRVCEALAHAGIVLRFGDVVFLRPQDVVEIMMRSVPDLEEEVVARLRELEGELKPLAEQQRKIEARAYRRTHGVLWGGLGFLVLQWGIFLHFTYSELSWDVVEPVTYFTSQLWAILGYCYFLATKEDFAYRHAHSKMSQNFTVGGERDHGFDRERYERLLREHSRYRRYLRIPAAEGQ